MKSILKKFALVKMCFTNFTNSKWEKVEETIFCTLFDGTKLKIPSEFWDYPQLYVVLALLRKCSSAGYKLLIFLCYHSGNKPLTKWPFAKSHKNAQEQKWLKNLTILKNLKEKKESNFSPVLNQETSWWMVKYPRSLSHRFDCR